MKRHKFVARSLKGSPLAHWLKKKHLKLVSGVVTVKAIPKKGTLKTRALKLAAAQVGIKESPAGSNRQKFGVWFGMNGVAWCAIFVSWVLSHIGRAFKYASVPQILADARAHGNGLSVIAWSKVPATLAAGHVVLATYDWPGESPGVPDHVGIVKQVLDAHNFVAIEGNTSPSTAGSQSNGGEVCLKQRHVVDVEAFVLVAG